MGDFLDIEQLLKDEQTHVDDGETQEKAPVDEAAMVRRLLAILGDKYTELSFTNFVNSKVSARGHYILTIKKESITLLIEKDKHKKTLEYKLSDDCVYLNENKANDLKKLFFERINRIANDKKKRIYYKGG